MAAISKPSPTTTRVTMSWTAEDAKMLYRVNNALKYLISTGDIILNGTPFEDLTNLQKANHLESYITKVFDNLVRSQIRNQYAKQSTQDADTELNSNLELV